MDPVSGGQADPGMVVTMPTSAVASTSGLKTGTVLRAEVMDYIASGMVALKVIIPAGRTEGQSAMQEKLFLNAQSRIPMSRGQTVFLEVSEGEGGGIALKFLGLARGVESSGAMQGQARQLLAGLADSRVSSGDLSRIMETLKSLPSQVRNALPELATLERILPGIQRLDAAGLRSAVEGSGMMYEPKVKLAVIQGLSGSQSMASSNLLSAAVQRFAQAVSSPMMDQALRALGGQSLDMLGRVLQGGAQAGDDLLSGMMKTISNPSIGSALKAGGVSGGDIELVMNALAGKLSSSSGGDSSVDGMASALQRFTQATLSPAVGQAFQSLGLGAQHVELLGRVLQGGAQVGDDTISAMIKTIANPVVGSALKAGGASGGDIELAMNVLASRLGSPSGGGSGVDGIAQALKSLSEGPYSGVLPRLTDALGNEGVINALKAQGITEPEIAMLINALGGRMQISQMAMAGIMQMQAGQLRKGLIQKFAESVETPEVSSSLKGAGLTDSEVGVIARLLSGRGMASESMQASFQRLAQKDDLKETLLKLGEKLGQAETARLLRGNGYDAGEIRASVDKALGNIEFYQLSTKVEGMLHMFLPVMWDGLKDGELIFRKREERGKSVYSCDINLDMNPLGSVAFSVTSYDGAMYLSMLAERPETEAAIRSARGELTRGLLAQGLSVSAMNIGQRSGLQPGDIQERGINIKV